ncbi:hypothetical protein [Arthrobacter bambusae]|uniref:hypothetical protein n=1 Tax=Arthrobacter bambusae TaxID=1338426 RepID=UPI003FD8E4F9
MGYSEAMDWRSSQLQGTLDDAEDHQQLGLGTAGRAYAQFEFACFDHAAALGVYDGKLSRGDCEREPGALPGGKLYLLKGLELLVGSAGGGHAVADVGLHCFANGPLLCVLHRDLCAKHVVGRYLLLKEPQPAVLHAGVGEPFAEREGRVL